jgi:hypothetical protein
MTLTNAREIVAAGWILILFSVGLLAHITTVSGWAGLTLLAGSGLIILRMLWRVPAETISQSIREARR